MIDPIRVKVSPQSLKSPFVALEYLDLIKPNYSIRTNLFFLAFFITEVRGGFLVDAVVCEVSEQVVNFGTFVSVLVGGESDQTVVIEVDTEWVHTGDENIKSQVKLGLVDQVRSGYVSEHGNYYRNKFYLRITSVPRVASWLVSGSTC